MSAGYHDFTSREKLTAANVEDYLLLQSVMRFTSATARDTALSAVLTEGLHAYLIDVNTLTVYTGSAWSTVGPLHGALLAWAPTVTQSGAVAATTTNSWYTRNGRRISCNLYAVASATGTGANVVTVSLPVTAAASVGTWGSGSIYDTSAGFVYPGLVVPNSTTTVKLMDSTAAGAAPAYLGLGTFTAALASGDILAASFQYDAAGDA